MKPMAKPLSMKRRASLAMTKMKPPRIAPVMVPVPPRTMISRMS